MISITHDDFLSTLIGARHVDIYSPRTEAEQFLWNMFAFTDEACVYLPTDERGLENLGAVIWQHIKDRQRLLDESSWLSLEPGSWAIQ